MREPADSDGDLLLALQKRDIAALEQLYDRHATYVMGIALRILGSREEAEEVVQDVFWKLWRTQLDYDPTRGRFTTWLFTVTRNRSIDRTRRRARHPVPAVLPDLTAGDDDPEIGAGVAEARVWVRKALGSLTSDQRESLELAFFEGLTHSEIADRTGEPLGTVKSRIKRGMERMRALMTAPGGGS